MSIEAQIVVRLPEALVADLAQAAAGPAAARRELLQRLASYCLLGVMDRQAADGAGGAGRFKGRSSPALPLVIPGAAGGPAWLNIRRPWPAAA